MDWRVFHILAWVFALLATPLSGAAQDGDWEPRRPMTLVVPANPGGGWDQTARFLQRAAQDADLVPTSLDVINRGGAGGTIALAELVTRGRGDPHRLMIGGFGMTSSSLMNGSEFSPLSTTPIARLTGEYQVIAVPADSSFQSVGELFDAMKARGTGVSFAGGSAGGSDQIFIVQAAMMQGMDPEDVNYVAFGGGGDASSAILGGQVTAGVSGYGEFAPLAEAGRLRLLAISAPDRRVDPDVPTLKESGLDLEFQNWRGIFAAPGISEGQRQWLTEMVSAARATELWQEVLRRNGWQDSFLVGEEFRDFIDRDRESTRSVMEAMGLAGGGGVASTSPVGPWAFPVVVGLALLVCVGVIAVSGRRAAVVGVEAATSEAHPSWTRFAMLLGALALYAVAITLVGFTWATPPFILGVCLIFSRRFRLWMAVFAGVATASIWAVFELALGVGLP